MDCDAYARVGLLYLLVCVAFAALASGCGLPLPLENAERCETNLYRAPDAAQNCSVVTRWRDHASDVTGVDLRRVLIYVSDQSTAAEIGHPDAWGVTQAGTVYIANRQLPTLIHEAYHVANGSPGHCDWSHTHIPQFNAEHLAGAFDDTCAHVHCSTSGDVLDADGVNVATGNYACWSL